MNLLISHAVLCILCLLLYLQVVQGEVEVQEGRLVSICEMGQVLQDSLAQDSEGYMVISNWLEVMQDRYNSLSDLICSFMT